MTFSTTKIDELPTSSIVVDALNQCFEHSDIDLRDVTYIAKQDPVVLANIIFLVNEFFSKRGSPVVNALTAGINLVGLQPLKEKLLSIKAYSADNQSKYACELIRSRIYVSACLTQFWGEYMGQTSIDEIYCASMFTGIADFSHCLQDGHTIKQSRVNYESIETIQTLFNIDESQLSLMPDSIQVMHNSGNLSDRLKLSILVYELVAALEFGYSTKELKQAMQDLCEYVGIGIHRAGYDLARQLVHIERSADHHSCYHSQYLLSTNLEFLEPAIF